MTERESWPRAETLLRSATVLALALLFLHVIAWAGQRDPGLLLPHAVGWLHDCAILALLAGVAAALARLGRRTWARVAFHAGFGLLLAPAMVLALYPRILPVFLAAPANIFAADAATAGTFFRHYLGVGALWPSAVVLAAGVAGRRIPFRIRRAGRRGFFATLALLLLTGLTLGRDSPNPVVFGLQESLRHLGKPRAVPRLSTSFDDVAGSPLEPAVDWSAAARAARYDHLLLAVLEGVTAADFETAFIQRPRGFFERHRQHAQYYSRYYATNLDSYTALLAMTTAVQVPFRAYATPERYAAVNDAPNILRGLRSNGFRTLFVSTYAYQPFVPNPRDWEKILGRRDLGDLGQWISVGSNRMEAATEDRAALPAIVEFMTAQPRSFVLAELVFGHSPEWRVKTGLAPLDYYDRYLGELWGRLADAGLSARTLLVVVSDHGDRSRPAEPENYRVPLLVLGEDQEQGVDDALRSHLDFQGIITHHLAGLAMPAARSAVTFVGSTERWTYGMLLATGEYAFLDDRTGRLLAGNLSPGFVHEAFQAQVPRFAATFLGLRQ